MGFVKYLLAKGRELLSGTWGLVKSILVFFAVIWGIAGAIMFFIWVFKNDLFWLIWVLGSVALLGWLYYKYRHEAK